MCYRVKTVLTVDLLYRWGKKSVFARFLKVCDITKVNSTLNPQLETHSIEVIQH
jgi:hypothetical protein